MSLQAIAGIAFDRRHPNNPTLIAQQQVEVRQAKAFAAKIKAGNQPAGEDVADDKSAQAAAQVNNALEMLKRYIPTELLAIYMPIILVLEGHFTTAAPIYLPWLYGIFTVSTPFVVWALYLAKGVELGVDRATLSFPRREALLALLAFAIWGASVPSVFVGSEWWLGILALVSSVVLPLLDTMLSGKKAPPANPPAEGNKNQPN